MTLSNNEKPRGSCWRAFGFVAVSAAVVVMVMTLPNEPPRPRASAAAPSSCAGWGYDDVGLIAISGLIFLVRAWFKWAEMRRNLNEANQ